MCDPILIGMGVGAAIGGAKGGAKGAILGAGFGALGGAALGPGLAGGAAAGTVPGVALTNSGAIALTGAGGGAGGAAGGGFLSGAFGTGSFGSFITSPGLALSTQVLGFGIQALGANQQAAYQQAMIKNQQQVLDNRLIAIGQDSVAREEALEQQLQNISDAGAVGRGDIRTEQAGRGVLVDRGSARDRTEQLSAEVAFAKLTATHKVELAKRQDRLFAAGLTNDRAVLGANSQQIATASVYGNIGTALQTAGSISSKFRFNNGSLSFRT